jgi:hypothetical protein
MNKYPVGLEKRAPRAPRKATSPTIEAVSQDNPVFSFRYAYTEISAVGGRARVKSRNARYADGKLTTEVFDGELQRSVYDRMVGEAQRHMFGQADLLARWFVPFLASSRDFSEGD